MMTKATEQDILDFVSELEAEPAPDSLGLASLAPGNDIPAKRREAGRPCFDWQGQRGRRRSAHTRTS